MMLATALTLFLLHLLPFLIPYNASNTPFAGAWFNFGYIAYLIGVIAIGMMAMIYRYFEHTLSIAYYRATKVLAALNFVLMNAGDNNRDLAYDDNWIYGWSIPNVI